jgi:predicted NAD/FAD-dependent oxidoreductase
MANECRRPGWSVAGERCVQARLHIDVVPKAIRMRMLDTHVFSSFRVDEGEEPLPQRYLLDGDLELGACGDWCGGPRVEGAFLSGLALAEAVLEMNEIPG